MNLDEFLNQWACLRSVIFFKKEENKIILMEMRIPGDSSKIIFGTMKFDNRKKVLCGEVFANDCDGVDEPIMISMSTLIRGYGYEEADFLSLLRAERIEVDNLIEKMIQRAEKVVKKGDPAIELQLIKEEFEKWKEEAECEEVE